MFYIIIYKYTYLYTHVYVRLLFFKLIRVKDASDKMIEPHCLIFHKGILG